MKGLRILSDPDEILLLGNRNAHAILKLLMEKEFSGTDIAKVLGIKAQLATYYLNKLEKHGLAEIVRTVQIRGTLKKFFRATTENYLIYSDIGETSNEINLSLSSAYLEKLQFTHLLDKINNCINLIIDDCLRITEDDKVLIQYPGYASKYLENIVMRLRSIGAEYRYNFFSEMLVQQIWSSLPIDKLERNLDGASEMLKWPTVFIAIGEYPQPDLTNIKESRVKAVSSTLYENEHKLNMNDDIRFASLLILPFEKDFLTDSSIVERVEMFWDAASLNSKDFVRIKKIADYLLENNSLTIHTPNHNELRVKLRKENYYLSAGPYSKTSPFPDRLSFVIPSGCLDLLPEEDGINGEIYCDIGEMGRISGVKLRVENNVVKDAKALKGDEELQSRLQKYGIEGRTISMIGFGLNKSIRIAERLPELSNYMFGTVNIVFGHNEFLGGNIGNVNQWILTCQSPELKTGDTLILSSNEYRLP